jgi:uncharacterized protein (TIGR03083 family)
VTRTQVQHAAEAVAARIADMVRDLPDTAIPIPRSEWTVGEAAAHLAFTNLGLAMMARGLQIPYGDGTRQGLAEANEVALEGFGERDACVLAQRILDGAHMVFAEAAAQPPDRVCFTPMGPMDVDGLTSYLLVHQAMHGSAIATALGAPWPFDPEDVVLMWPFISHVIPRVVRAGAAAGLTACFEMQFGEGFGFAVMFDGGELTVARSPSRPVDCRLSADPQTLFLVLVRILPIEEAVRSGDLTISGPRAELGTTLIDLFNIP